MKRCWLAGASSRWSNNTARRNRCIAMSLNRQSPMRVTSRASAIALTRLLSYVRVVCDRQSPSSIARDGRSSCCLSAGAAVPVAPAIAGLSAHSVALSTRPAAQGLVHRRISRCTPAMPHVLIPVCFDGCMSAVRAMRLSLCCAALHCTACRRSCAVVRRTKSICTLTVVECRE
jgi:hypothetical protein